MAITTRPEALKALGLSVRASKSDIKNAYKRLSKKYHPDVAGDKYTDFFQKVNEAYEFLSGDAAVSAKILGNDHAKMARYDNRKSNEEVVKRYERNKKQREKEKEEALRQASISARHKAEEEKIRIEQEKLEIERHVRAAKMAKVISEMMSGNI